MAERIEPLEAELSDMRPRPLNSALVGRIEADLAGGAASRWGDRMLLSAMTAGALAACVIVALLIFDMRPDAPAIPVASVDVPRIGDTSQMLAHAGHSRRILAEVP